MPRFMLRLTMLLLCGVAVAAGCSGHKKLAGSSKPDQPLPPPPPHRAGTIAQYAVLDGALDVQVTGYGLVIGLEGRGSAQAPAPVEKYLKEYLVRAGFGSYKEGLQDITPEMILRDKNSAAVLVSGTIPALAPKGARFDLTVQALPRTQTTSLEGGKLMITRLFMTVGGVPKPMGGSKEWASAEGDVMVNPFLTGSDKEASKYLEGRVANGGLVKVDTPIRLVLKQSSYQIAQLITERVNERFRDSQTTVARGSGMEAVSLTVPAQYRGDYGRFLELVMHLPLATGAQAWEARAREIGTLMEGAEANRHELAMVWEAMGRQVLPVVKDHYQSKNSEAAYYAARTGLRLGDGTAMDVVVFHAKNANSQLRMQAIEELGRHKGFAGLHALQDLVNDSNDQVRLAAYESLLKRGDTTGTVTRTRLDGFYLDIVKSNQSRVVYASQTGQPRLVLFGDVMCNGELFYSSRDDLVTISGSSDHEHLQVFRKIAMTGKFSPTFKVDRDVKSLVELLGTPASPDYSSEAKGLSIAYGQVVGVLYQLCKRGDIPAKFVLQELPEVQRISSQAVSVGRPDTPE